MKAPNSKTRWYLIDNHILGKSDSYGCYIFNNGTWEEDNNGVILDCLLGYDQTEEGPYAIGNTEIMDRIQEITEIEAVSFMKMQ